MLTANRFQEWQLTWLRVNGFEDGVVPVGQRHTTERDLFWAFAPLFGSADEMLKALYPLLDQPGEEQERKDLAVSCFEQKANELHLSRAVLQCIGSVRSQDVAVCPMLPELFPAMELLLKQTPREWHPTAIIGCLPVLGAILTGLRFDWRGQVNSCSFIAFVVGEQSSGKSATTMPLWNLLLAPLRKKDAAAINAVSRYHFGETDGDGDEEHRKRPLPVIREVLSKTSQPTIYQQMSVTRGVHLILAAQDLAAVVNSAARGAYASLSPILLASWGNEPVGQQTSIQTAVYVKVEEALFNVAACTTPAVLKRFFGGGKVEDGTLSRSLFVLHPTSTEDIKPNAVQWSEEEREAVDELIGRLYEIGNRLPGRDAATGRSLTNSEFPLTVEAMENWYAQRWALIETLSESHAAMQRLLIHRAATNAMRAGAVFATMNGGESDATVALAVWVADYAIYAAITLFHSEMEEMQIENRTATMGKLSYRELFFSLPAVFTKDQLTEIRESRGESTKSLSTIVSRWQSEGHLEVLERGTRWLKVF